MPPHAARKSPDVTFFSCTVLGEWSDDNTAIAPLCTALRSAPRFAALRSGGAHL